MPKILVIDDNTVELQKAVAAGTAAGFECVPFNPDDSKEQYCPQGGTWIEILNENTVAGVVTDLFWRRLYSKGSRAHTEDPSQYPPSGLCVVIHGLALGKPVVICTDAKNDNGLGHHGQRVGFIYDGYLARGSSINGKDAFGWIEDKNWGEAFDELKRMLCL